MFLQLHLHERKLFPIGSISVGDRNTYCRDNIHWDSLAQRCLSVYKLHSLLENLLGYIKLLNLNACFYDKKSLAA